MAYRGVDDNKVRQSVDAAVAFLSKHSTGPEMDRLLANLATLAPERASGLFSRISELLEYHALVNTDGKGLDILKNLQAWSATSGAYTTNYTRIDEEKDCYLAAAFAKIITLDAASIQKISAHMSGSARDSESLNNAMDAVVDILSHAGAADHYRATYVRYTQLDLHERYLVSQSLRAVSGVYEKPLPAMPQAMGRYGLVVEGLMNGSKNWGDPEIRAIGEKVNDVLAPFWESGEVTMTGIGMIGDSMKSPQGIMFVGTLSAAQAVAAAFPGEKVISGKGKRIDPPAKKPHQNGLKP